MPYKRANDNAAHPIILSSHVYTKTALFFFVEIQFFITSAVLTLVIHPAFTEEAAQEDRKKEDKDVEGRGGVLGGLGGYGAGSRSWSRGRWTWRTLVLSVVECRVMVLLPQDTRQAFRRAPPDTTKGSMTARASAQATTRVPRVFQGGADGHQAGFGQSSYGKAAGVGLPGVGLHR
ncbi:hypothetical protein MRX96_008845 [Rhipicephalus microplus]